MEAFRALELRIDQSLIKNVESIPPRVHICSAGIISMAQAVTNKAHFHSLSASKASLISYRACIKSANWLSRMDPGNYEVNINFIFDLGELKGLR